MCSGVDSKAPGLRKIPNMSVDYFGVYSPTKTFAAIAGINDCLICLRGKTSTGKTFAALGKYEGVIDSAEPGDAVIVDVASRIN